MKLTEKKFDLIDMAFLCLGCMIGTAIHHWLC